MAMCVYIANEIKQKEQSECEKWRDCIIHPQQLSFVSGFSTPFKLYSHPPNQMYSFTFS